MPFPHTDRLPASLDEAVSLLVEAMTDEERKAILESGFGRLHRTLGMTIRNAWGLWGQNRELIESCLGVQRHGHRADTASGKILVALQERLREIMENKAP